MQLPVDEGMGWDEWTTCSGGVLLAGFRGVEIPYNVRDVCVDSFNPMLPSDGRYRVHLFYTVHRYIKLWQIDKLCTWTKDTLCPFVLFPR